MYTIEDFNKAAEFIKSKTNTVPEIGIILGSGLHSLAGLVENAVKIPYADIPLFPKTTNPNHEGALYIGTLCGKAVAVLSGRFHHYEGYSMQEATFPIGVLKLVGVTNLIVTNAAGGINKSFKVGSLMIITDQIHLTVESPLRGYPKNLLGERFFDMCNAYDKQYQKLAKQAASELNIDINEGVYALMLGPQFETPAEIRLLSALGADAVGMSTTPDVIMANYCGMRVLGISCISNMAAGISEEKLFDDDVIKVGKSVSSTFVAVVQKILEKM